MKHTKRRSHRHLAATAAAGAVIAGAAAALLTAAPAQALHGQTDAAPGQFPYYAVIGIWGFPDAGCGGAMIDPEWMITAAHCADSTRGGNDDVIGVPVTIAGYDGNAISTTVEEVKKAPAAGPDGTWFEDVALVRVAPRPNVPTIALSNTTIPVGGSYITAASGTGSPGYRLGWADMKVIEQTENGMSGASKDPFTIFNDKGDSGSPAIIKTPEGDRLVGLLSSGGGSHEEGVTTYSMRLDYPPVWNWIHETLPKLDFAASHPGYYEIRNVNSGLLLDIEGYSTSDGGRALQWPRTGNANQQWSFRTVDGKTQIVNRNSGLQLGITGSLTGDGAPAIQWHSVGAPDQGWNLVSRADGDYTLINDNSGKVLAIGNASTAPGDGAIQWTSTGESEQKWQLIKVG